MWWFFLIVIPAIAAALSEDEKKTKGVRKKTAPARTKVVKVELSEVRDADILEFLKNCKNKGEFFRFAAREYLKKDEE